MARIRSVHPDICVSDTMFNVGALCVVHDSPCGCLERTFSRLWTHCDDHGRCLDNARLIKAAIYPLDDDLTTDRLDAELGKLSDARLIYRYTSDGKRLLQVRSWGEFQHPNRPKNSKWPAPKSFEIADHVRVTGGSVQGQGADTVGVGEGGIVRALALHSHEHDFDEPDDVLPLLAEARAQLKAGSA